MTRMIIEADLLGEVVLLLDENYQVRDAFIARGPTRHECDYPVLWYTYRSLLTLPGCCCVCGVELDQIQKPCSSSGGFHALVGVAEVKEIPAQHKVEQRSIQVRRLNYEEMDFYVEADNLFPIGQISQAMPV